MVYKIFTLVCMLILTGCHPISNHMPPVNEKFKQAHDAPIADEYVPLRPRPELPPEFSQEADFQKDIETMENKAKELKEKRPSNVHKPSH